MPVPCLSHSRLSNPPKAIKKAQSHYISRKRMFDCALNLQYQIVQGKTSGLCNSWYVPADTFADFSSVLSPSPISNHLNVQQCHQRQSTRDKSVLPPKVEMDGSTYICIKKRLITSRVFIPKPACLYLNSTTSYSVCQAECPSFFVTISLTVRKRHCLSY